VPTTPPSPDGIEIWYTTDGDPSGVPVLMIMGLGTQYLGWDDDLVARFVDRGCFVIRHDNRDVGLSTKPVPEGFPVLERLMAAFAGQPVEAPYLLSDMAADSVRVLDALGVRQAHVIGASMGGMIAQTVAIEHPDRVLSLTSIMSTTGAAAVGQPKPEVMGVLMTPPATTREDALVRGVETSRAIGSPGLVDEEKARRRAGAAWDRDDDPRGVGHQLLAIVASPDRTEALGRVAVPTLVVHGDVDPLVTLSGGEATAAAVPAARLVVLPGVGHDIPEVHWDRVVGEVCDLIGIGASA
jgi:pimeloyl-ACP methyl ester carboxylesterase